MRFVIATVALTFCATAFDSIIILKASEPATVLIPLDLEHTGCTSRKVVVTDGVPYCIMPVSELRNLGQPYMVTVEQGAPIARPALGQEDWRGWPYDNSQPTDCEGDRCGPSHGYPNLGGTPR